jgi:hypothetical protein
MTVSPRNYDKTYLDFNIYPLKIRHVHVIFTVHWRVNHAVLTGNSRQDAIMDIKLD